ncbi:hypothetical protein LOTGIDRAFT_91892, partial [Lottia gigantea]
WRAIPLGVLLASLCLLTTIGNALVLHAVRTEKRLQSVSNMFIVSLAIADLIVGLTVMPISAIYIFTQEWLFGVVVCQAWIGVDYIASTASILNLFILSLDRYWSVRSPLVYLRKRTKRRALIMISIVWCASSMWIIPIVAWHHIVRQGIRIVPENVCDTEYATNSAFKVITAFFNFYLPLAVMYSLYIKIFQEIRKRSEFELGQRNIGTKPVTYHASPPSHSGDDSDLPDHHNFTENTYQQQESSEEQKRSSYIVRRSNSNGKSNKNSKNSKGYKNLRLIAVQRQMSNSRENHSNSYKVDDRDKTMFVLRDDKNRRLTGVLNIKDRIRHLRQTSALTKEIKAARQLGVIMGAFTLCFLPYFILFLVVAFCEGCIEPGLLTAMTWVGYLNSTLNPFLYPLCNLQFRRKFRKMFGV